MGGETPGLSEEEATTVIGKTKTGEVIEQIVVEDPYKLSNPSSKEATHEEVDDLIKDAFGKSPVPKGHVVTEAEAEMQQDLKGYEQGEHNN